MSQQTTKNILDHNNTKYVMAAIFAGLLGYNDYQQSNVKANQARAEILLGQLHTEVLELQKLINTLNQNQK